MLNGLKGVVRIANCYSGVLGGPYRRVALATEKAFSAFSKDSRLQQQIRQKVGGREDQHLKNILSRARFNAKMYEARPDWLTFGIRLFQPEEQERDDYAEAERALISMGSGIHRRLFFGIKGIATTKSLETLPDNLYAAMLAKIREKHNDPDLLGITSIDIKDISFDEISDTGDGLKAIVFSRRQLEAEPKWAHLVIADL